jgi:hypothetical protein
MQPLHGPLPPERWALPKELSPSDLRHDQEYSKLLEDPR